MTAGDRRRFRIALLAGPMVPVPPLASGMRHQIVPHRPLQSATLESCTEVVRHVVDHGIRYGSPTEHAG
jgi:hypothetical protein